MKADQSALNSEEYMEKEWPSVTIYVLNWNGRSLLESCLPPLLKLDYPQYEIVLIDNNSSDDSVAYTQTTFPQIRLIQNEGNIGFSKGMNVGLHQHKNDIAVLLNTDVEVTTNWLTELVRPIKEDPSIGITGSKLYFGDGLTLQHAGAVMEFPLARGKHRFYGEEDEGQADEQCVVEYVTGASMAISKAAIAATDGFDEDFSPFYYEEVDLCYRAKDAGFKIVYAPKSVALHHESMTFKQFSRPLFHNLNRNRLLFILKHLPLENFLNDYVAAEKEFLKTRALVERLQTMHQVYIEMLLKLNDVLLARGLEKYSSNYQAVLVDLAETAVQQPSTSYQPSQTEIQMQLSNLSDLQPLQFRSDIPIVGMLITKIRQYWGSIAAKWMVFALQQQQTTINQTLSRKMDEQAKQQQILSQEITFLTTEIDKLQEQFVKKSNQLHISVQNRRLKYRK